MAGRPAAVAWWPAAVARPAVAWWPVMVAARPVVAGRPVACRAPRIASRPAVEASSDRASTPVGASNRRVATATRVEPANAIPATTWGESRRQRHRRTQSVPHDPTTWLIQGAATQGEAISASSASYRLGKLCAAGSTTRTRPPPTPMAPVNQTDFGLARSMMASASMPTGSVPNTLPQSPPSRLAQ